MPDIQLMQKQRDGYFRRLVLCRQALIKINNYFKSKTYRSMEGKLSRNQLRTIRELVEITLEKTKTPHN